MRFFLFLVMIAAGAGVGLLYGWVINPVQYQDSMPDKLHPVYQADYVLMVAEIYQADQNLDEARQRLVFLGSRPPEEIAAEALQTARELDYQPADQERMVDLVEALSPAAERLP